MTQTMDAADWLIALRKELKPIEADALDYLLERHGVDAVRDAARRLVLAGRKVKVGTLSELLETRLDREPCGMCADSLWIGEPTDTTVSRCPCA